MHRIVLDTNVVVAALRSRNGASFAVMSRLDSDEFVTCLSVPVVIEYEAVAMRLVGSTHSVSRDDIEGLVDYMCKVGVPHVIDFLWRPFLRDANDDMILELAVNARCDFIVTHNIRDFRGVERFGIQSITPKEFLKLLEVQP
ncbi:MAG: putative toxin-antitoxin system toxin component, PIN family [Chloroflexi bacterium]|nr:putative toxin-antitoxin system toxin component, PIN family [Chloroflexota bacterium]